MDLLVEELLKFSDDILSLGNPITDDRIKVFEEKYTLALPEDFKKFISMYNGISLMGKEVYGFDINRTESIENIYIYEHNEVAVPLFPELVPFSSDGGGNFYCFDTRQSSSDSCVVVFWVSNYQYTKEDLPEVVNESFTAWFKEVMIDWTLESYNYDGTSK